MTPRTAQRSRRVIRIKRGWVEDAPPEETWGNGKPGVWALVVVLLLCSCGVLWIAGSSEFGEGDS